MRSPEGTLNHDPTVCTGHDNVQDDRNVYSVVPSFATTTLAENVPIINDIPVKGARAFGGGVSDIVSKSPLSVLSIGDRDMSIKQAGDEIAAVQLVRNLDFATLERIHSSVDNGALVKDHNILMVHLRGPNVSNGAQNVHEKRQLRSLVTLIEKFHSEGKPFMVYCVSRNRHWDFTDIARLRQSKGLDAGKLQFCSLGVVDDADGLAISCRC